MAYVRINGNQIPHVQLVETVIGGRTFVRCVADSEAEATKLYEALSKLNNSGVNLEFDMLSGNGLRVKFDGKILFAANQPNLTVVNFTAEPAGKVTVK